MRTLPATGFLSDFATGPALDYNIVISNPGIYILWLRYDGANDSQDSLFAGIPELADGPGGTVDWYQYYDNLDADFDTNPWVSLGGFEANEPAPARIPTAFEFPAPGEYTLRVVMREDGVALDSWILQMPPPAVLDPTNTNPIITVPDTMVMHHLAKAGIAVLNNDSGDILPATVEIVTPPDFGTASPMADGRILYEHTTGSPAEDRFTYRVLGQGGSTSAPASVVVTFSVDLRIPNSTVTMPVAPPPTQFSVVDAFPTIADFTAPTAMASPPGDTNRIFVIQRNGQVHVITGIGGPTPQRSLFMDISDRVDDFGDNELGLKGIAFHPDYANNRAFYLTYCHWDGANRRVRLSRFLANAGDPDLGDAGSELILINHLNREDVHNINGMIFGSDGYLYLSMGDEGFTAGQADGRNNSQFIDKDMWSGILRLDVDKQPGSLAPNPHPAINGPATNYAIPPDNPFIGATQFNGIAVSPADVRTEFYVVGIRNAWQFSFDELTGDFWVADVGNNAREKVSIMPPGSNGGWVFYEGTIPGPRPDRVPPPGFEFVQPVWEYDHNDPAEFSGKSIIGGFVYRGNDYPDLYGKYLCGDFISGNIWTVERTVGATNVVRITGEGFVTQYGLNPANGDILMINFVAGRIRKLQGQSDPLAFPETLSETGFFADLTDLSPNPGLVAYEPNLSFWSDYGIKRRWFVITNTTDRVGTSVNGNWTYPEGMMWVKHFDLEMDRGNPDTKKRLETRVLVKTGTGSFGVSYQWNEDETEAFLVPDAGADFNLAITNAGQPEVQAWRIPSRAECIICHNPGGGHALSFNTRQLNAPGTMVGLSNNFIHLLDLAGYTSNSLGNPNLLPRHVRPDETEVSLEARARSYIAVNCAYCHMGAEGSVPGQWDGREFLKLFDTGMILGSASDNQGNTNNLLVVPGDITHSIIWNRIAATNGFSRMPPLATAELDHENIQLVADWIVTELAGRQSFAQWQIEHFGSTNHPDAGPDDDPDEDGRSNEEEFLTYTNPNNEFDFWVGTVAAYGEGNALVAHDLPNRRVIFEITTNMTDWVFWNVPENTGIPIAPGVVRALDVPDNDPMSAFRFLIEEP